MTAGAVSIVPNTDSQTFVNGRLITEVEELRTGSRIILGNNHVFRFTSPEQGVSAVCIVLYVWLFGQPQLFPLPGSTTHPLLTHSLTHPPTHSPTHSLTHPPTHSLTHSLTHPPTHSLNHSLTHPPTHPLIHSLTHSLTHPPTHSLTHSLTPPLTLSSSHQSSLPHTFRHTSSALLLFTRKLHCLQTF